MSSPLSARTSAAGLFPSDVEWVWSSRVRAYGVKFDVRTNAARVVRAMIDRLPPGARQSDRAMPTQFRCAVLQRSGVAESQQAEIWQVWLDDELHDEVFTEAEALTAFEWCVRFEVARRTPRWTFVHAGAVGWNGMAILIPGQSYSGKSTLVQALVKAGAEYYSDEFAVLDRRGRLYPFAQPLMERRPDGTRGRLDVRDSGGTIGRRALPVGLLVSTRHTADAQWRPVVVTPGEALLTLLSNTVRAQRAPASVMRVLARVAETATMIESDRGEADTTAATLLETAARWQSPGLRSIA